VRRLTKRVAVVCGALAPLLAFLVVAASARLAGVAVFHFLLIPAVWRCCFRSCGWYLLLVAALAPLSGICCVLVLWHGCSSSGRFLLFVPPLNESDVRRCCCCFAVAGCCCSLSVALLLWLVLAVRSALCTSLLALLVFVLSLVLADRRSLGVICLPCCVAALAGFWHGCYCQHTPLVQ